MLLNIIPIIWILGMVLILMSTPTSIIKEIGHQDIVENKPYYGIKHIKLVISMISDDSIIEKLKHKILMRKIGYTLLLIVPILILFNGCLSNQ